MDCIVLICICGDKLYSLAAVFRYVPEFIQASTLGVMVVQYVASLSEKVLGLNPLDEFLLCGICMFSLGILASAHCPKTCMLD